MRSTSKGIPVLALCIVTTLAWGCANRDHDDATSSDYNLILEGNYLFLDFGRATSTTIAPDLESRAGLLNADGKGLFTVLSSVGSPLTTIMRSYAVDPVRRIDASTTEPGCTLPKGEFFAMGDLDRVDGNNVGMGLFSRAGSALTLDVLVDSPVTTTRYHAVYFSFLRPGVVAGHGYGEITKVDDTNGTWKIDVSLLGTSSSLVRNGTFAMAQDGALLASDLSTGRTYMGFAEPNGDWLAWMEIDTSIGRIWRLDLLVREGSGLSDATLNGRFNVLGFWENRTNASVDTVFGNIAFDGQGAFSDFELRDSFGSSIPANPVPQPYSVASDGTVSLLGDVAATGYVTRNADRRWLIFPDTAPDGRVGIFFALKR